MAIALVQQNSPSIAGGAASGYWNYQDHVTSHNFTFGSSTTTGNLIVVGVQFGSSSTPSITVSDNKGNGNYSLAASAIGAAGGGSYDYIFYKENAIGGASHQITVSNGNGDTDDNGHIWIAEFSGIATSSSLDKTGSNNVNIGGAATSYAVSTAALSQADELAIANFTSWYLGSGNTLTKPGSPWTNGYTITDCNDTPSAGSVYQIVNSTSALTATWTFSAPGGSAPVGAAIATFKAAAGAATKAPPIFRKPLRFFNRRF